MNSEFGLKIIECIYRNENSKFPWQLTLENEDGEQWTYEDDELEYDGEDENEDF